MTLQLFHSPFACSLACRFALAEGGLAHKLEIVHLGDGANQTEAYAAINPRRKVPALATDRGVLTESTAILPYIADLVPERRLLPAPGSFERARAQSWLAFFTGTVHPCYTGFFRPALFSTDEAGLDAVKAAHLERLTKALSDIDAHLAQQPYLLDDYSLCDVYLLVFSLWRASPDLAGRLPALPSLDAHQARVLARAPVQEIFQDDLRLRVADAPAKRHAVQA